jgi:hypothetical protein
MADFTLARDSYGKLTLTDATGVEHRGISPVRAFPIADPEHGIALMSAEGHELVWIERLSDLPDKMRILLEDEIAGREFMPSITALRDVSSFSTPTVWQVETDRGPASFTLKSEDSIRRLGQDALLIADSHSIHYLIRDTRALDRHSRKLLDRFL